MLNETSKTEPECPIEIVQIGRQPILDRNQQTYGYELLYRHQNCGPEEEACGNLVTARTLLYTFLEFGVKRLVGPHRAFVNITRTLFMDMQPQLIDKERFVLEVLEDITIDADFVDGVRKLHESGYLIALDDYRFEPHWEPLLPYCSIIKVDILGLGLESFADQISRLKARGLLLLAEKVETHAEFEMTLGLGFDLFQGYFFAKPQVLSTPYLQSNQILLLKMIARINDPSVDLDELGRLVSQDPKLSFKVLRFINSAAIGLTKKTKSIRQAVIYIGLKKLRALVSLFVMSDLHVKSPEIMKMGLVRAELCRSMSKAFAVGEPESAYTVGLLSILDALMNQSMEQLVKDLPLPIDMIEALDKRAGPYSIGLNCVLALEQGQTLDPFAQSFPVDKLHGMYIQAMTSAEDILNELGSFS
jgi:EAL and modified HD-GYP domain-containing signal transduction protein